jgi:hypothetical protein
VPVRECREGSPDDPSGDYPGNCWAAQFLAARPGETCSRLVAGWFGQVPDSLWGSLDDPLDGYQADCWAAQLPARVSEAVYSRLEAGWFGLVREFHGDSPDVLSVGLRDGWEGVPLC